MGEERPQNVFNIINPMSVNIVGEQNVGWVAEMHKALDIETISLWFFVDRATNITESVIETVTAG